MKLDIGKPFGLALKTARRAANCTQDDLARASGLDRTYISLLERGCRKPSLESLMLLTLALNIETVPFVDAFLKHFEAANTDSIANIEPLTKAG